MAGRLAAAAFARLAHFAGIVAAQNFDGSRRNFAGDIGTVWRRFAGHRFGNRSLIGRAVEAVDRHVGGHRRRLRFGNRFAGGFGVDFRDRRRLGSRGLARCFDGRFALGLGVSLGRRLVLMLFVVRRLVLRLLGGGLLRGALGTGILDVGAIDPGRLLVRLVVGLGMHALLLGDQPFAVGDRIW